jgi:two-component system, OmpR family, heavy metal sensor histidine kinase CusS
VATGALSAEARTLQLAGNQVELVVEQDPELHANRPLLEVALANLLRNAARHAPGARVVLRVRRAGDRAVFEVDDAGPGVPPERREALFERFARGGDALRRDRHGLWLGLPIAREVARRHGGECALDAAPAGGLRARLEAPCLVSPDLTSS